MPDVVAMVITGADTITDDKFCEDAVDESMLD